MKNKVDKEQLITVATHIWSSARGADSNMTMQDAIAAAKQLFEAVDEAEKADEKKAAERQTEHQESQHQAA